MLAWVGRVLLKKKFITDFDEAIKFIYIDLKLMSHPLSFCLEASEFVLFRIEWTDTYFGCH